MPVILVASAPQLSDTLSGGLFSVTLAIQNGFFLGAAGLVALVADVAVSAVLRNSLRYAGAAQQIVILQQPPQGMLVYAAAGGAFVQPQLHNAGVWQQQVPQLPQQMQQQQMQQMQMQMLPHQMPPQQPAQQQPQPVLQPPPRQQFSAQPVVAEWPAKS